MREAQFQKKVINYLQSIRCWYCKIWGGGFQRAGIPDILVCINGKFLAIELKAPNGRASPLQKRNIRLIKKNGGLAYILYPEDFEEFKSDIQQILKEGDY